MASSAHEPTAGPSVSRLETLLEVAPGPAQSARVTGWVEWEPVANSPVSEQYQQPHRVILTADVDPESTLQQLGIELDSEPCRDFEFLVGSSASSGFRRRLSARSVERPAQLFIRRLLDDLPIVLRIAGQARLVDHPALPVRIQPVEPVTEVPGADQCEGWRSDGTLVKQIRDTHGTLVMALGDEVDDSVAAWSPQPPPAPMSTRRRRRLDLAGGQPPAAVVTFRDSYADPDGVERGLHSYRVQAQIGPEGTVDTIEATGLILPWPECWQAAPSAGRLATLPLADADSFARTNLIGRGTCTHLTDNLRTFSDLAPLTGLKRP